VSQIFEMLKVASPVFVRVRALAELVVPGCWFPKARLLAERLRVGAAAEPPPETATDCGLLPALSASVTAAAKGPLLLGAN
jgi:hypothetical protein